jgi:hypothetical protein
LVWPDLLFSDDFVLAGLAVLVAGTVRGFSGFGAGLVMIGPLSIIYGLTSAVVTVAVCDACAALTLLRGVWATADLKRALAAAISAATLLPLGTYILQVVDAELLRRIAGVLILFFIASIAAGVRWRGGGVSGSIAVGAIGGLVGGATSLIGPPMVLYMLARDEDAIRTRASLALLYFNRSCQSGYLTGYIRGFWAARRRDCMGDCRILYTYVRRWNSPG